MILMIAAIIGIRSFSISRDTAGSADGFTSIKNRREIEKKIPEVTTQTIETTVETTTESITETSVEITTENNVIVPEISAIAVITIRDYGEIEVELDASAAPISVENFISLAESGFYDGLTFHRIINGFMMQGGDPEGTGMGGSDVEIKGEFAANGVDNPILHTRGVISMARAQAYDSASSQFFIMHVDSPHLDGEYAGFGIVTRGIEIVDAICANTPVQDDNGTVLPDDQPVIESIRIMR